MRVGSLVLVLAAAAALAGCFEPRSDPRHEGQEWWIDALPSGTGHDHDDIAQHTGLSTPDFEVVAHDPLRSDHYGRPSGGTFCGDVQPGDGRRLAAVETRTDVGVAFADVTDPLAPTWIGEIVMPRTHIYDVAVVPDGRHAILVSSQTRNTMPGAWAAAAQQGADPIVWKDCRGTFVLHDEAPLPAHVFLVDILAEGGPRIVEQQPLPGFGHSVLAREIDGVQWVVVSAAHFRTQTSADAVLGDLTTVGGTLFYHLQPTPAGPHLALQSIFKPGPSDDVGPNRESVSPRAHDAWLHVHPVTGQTIAYLAGGNRFTVLDVTDPTVPRELARWTDDTPERAGYSGELHSAFALDETWDGRHYTVLGPEFANHPVDHPSGILWVLDTTDPARPTAVAGWTLPHEVEWNGTYQFSTHYFAIVGETLLVSMYHGGVWAVDLSPLRSARDAFLPLASTGVFLPDTVPETEPEQRHRWSPTLQEVVPIGDGRFVTFDGHTGLYVVRHDPAKALRPAPAWPITAP